MPVRFPHLQSKKAMCLCDWVCLYSNRAREDCGRINGLLFAVHSKSILMRRILRSLYYNTQQVCSSTIQISFRNGHVSGNVHRLNKSNIGHYTTGKGHDTFFSSYYCLRRLRLTRLLLINTIYKLTGVPTLNCRKTYTV